MHAMAHRSDLFLACSSKVNIYDPALYLTISNLLTVIQGELPKAQYPTAMSETKSINTSLLEIMISCKNECVFILDLCDFVLQIIFDAWLAWMNVRSKWPIAWDNSRYAPSWRFYLHCGIEAGCLNIICIISHQVLRHPSEHKTRSMGKPLLATAHIAKLNELTVPEVTELTSSTVDETALAILKRKGSRCIPIVSSQTKLKFTIYVWSTLIELRNKTL